MMLKRCLMASCGCKSHLQLPAPWPAGLIPDADNSCMLTESNLQMMSHTKGESRTLVDLGGKRG